MIIVDLEQFTPKNKPVIYIRVFTELYNWRNSKQVYEIYGRSKLEKMRTLTTKTPCNLGTY